LDKIKTMLLVASIGMGTSLIVLFARNVEEKNN
jgi:hypothetical protein